MLILGDFFLIKILFFCENIVPTFFVIPLFSNYPKRLTYNVIPTPSSDEYIIDLLRHRDTKGVSLMYDKYAAALLGVINRVVQSKEIAEEVLQDVFAKAWRNFESYDTSKGKLFTWLINISRNAAIDATRAKGFNRQNQTIENVVNSIDVQYHTVTNPDTMDVRTLAQKLSPEQYALVDLIYFQGFTQAEAAETMQIPLGTVKTRIRTSINLLRTFFSTVGVVFYIFLSGFLS